MVYQCMLFPHYYAPSLAAVGSKEEMDFRHVFSTVASRHLNAMVLDIYQDASIFQSDRVHPNVQGVTTKITPTTF
jgi:hypothetical protein